jgi:hypothetical protein
MQLYDPENDEERRRNDEAESALYAAQSFAQTHLAELLTEFENDEEKVMWAGSLHQFGG